MKELAEVRAAADEKEVYSQLKIGRLQTKCDLLENINDALTYKGDTQTVQVQGCESIVIKGAMKELAEAKVVAQEMEARLQCVTGILLEDSGKSIVSFHIQHSQTPIDNFKDPRGEWKLPLSQLEDELEASKDTLGRKEQAIIIMKEENMRLRQATKDLKSANQELKRKYMQTEYATDEDQGSVARSCSGEVIRNPRSKRPLEHQTTQTSIHHEPINYVTDLVCECEEHQRNCISKSQAAQTLPSINPSFADEAALPNYQCLDKSDQQAITWLDANIP